MRIALYHNLSSGGAKRTVFELVRRLATRHEIDVYTLSCADHDFADLRPHVGNHDVYRFQPLPLLPSPFGRLNQLSRLIDLRRIGRSTRQIADQVETRGYDVAFVHPCQIEVAPSLLAHLKQTPTVYFCQEPLRRVYEPMPRRPYDRHDTTGRRLLNAIDPLPGLYLHTLKNRDRYNTRSAGVILVNSQFIQQSVRDIYDRQARVSYLGVDLQQFDPQPDQRLPIVLSVGSLTPLKGFDFLIEAMARLPAARKTPLVIVSNFQNAPERNYLLQLAKERGVELQLRHGISDEQLRLLYSRAQVVAYAPIREPFGLVPVEAMACATPVVAVAEGGVRESVVHEQTGYLTERDPARFAAALDLLLADPRHAENMGCRGREHVTRNWSWDQAAARVETFLEGAAARPAKIRSGPELLTPSAG